MHPGKFGRVGIFPLFSPFSSRMRWLSKPAVPMGLQTCSANPALADQLDNLKIQLVAPADSSGSDKKIVLLHYQCRIGLAVLPFCRIAAYIFLSATTRAFDLRALNGIIERKSFRFAPRAKV